MFSARSSRSWRVCDWIKPIEFCDVVWRCQGVSTTTTVVSSSWGWDKILYIQMQKWGRSRILKSVIARQCYRYSDKCTCCEMCFVKWEGLSKQKCVQPPNPRPFPSPHNSQLCLNQKHQQIFSTPSLNKLNTIPIWNFLSSHLPPSSLPSMLLPDLLFP